jgi:acetolactate synthase-1/2/3 large subunit
MQDKPLFVLGNGSRGIHEKILNYCKKYDIPVISSFLGMDLVPTNHPCFVGRIGSIGTRSGNYAIQHCSHVFFLGTRNNIRQVTYNFKDLAKQAIKISVDIDKEELTKNTCNSNVALHMTVAEFYKYYIEGVEHHKCTDWLEECKRWDRLYPVVKDKYRKDIKINPYYLTWSLTQHFEDDAIIVLSNATPSITMFQAGIIKEGQTIITNSGSASMGYELPAAIGATISSGKRVYVLAGDGSIMMNIQELQTIKHYDLDITIIIFDNGGYSSIKQSQENFGNMECGINETSGMSLPDFGYVGSAFGFIVQTIDRRDVLDVSLAYYLHKKNRQNMLVVKLDPDATFEPKIKAMIDGNGKIISTPIDNMYPFVDMESKDEQII